MAEQISVLSFSVCIDCLSIFSATNIYMGEGKGKWPNALMTLRCKNTKIHFVEGIAICSAANHPVMVKANNFQCSDDDDDYSNNKLMQC